MKFFRCDSPVQVLILALSQIVGGATLAGQPASAESPASPAARSSTNGQSGLSPSPMPVPIQSGLEQRVGERRPVNSALDPTIPAPPPIKSPVVFFRELLMMTPAQRSQALTNRSPENRKLILAKVREYLSLNGDERELRLKATELEWRLVPLMKASPTNRAPLLAALSEEDRKMIEARLEEWDRLPEGVRKELLDRRESIRLYVQMKSAPATATNIYIRLRPKVEEDLKKLHALSEPERQKLVVRFNQYFDFNAREKEKVLRTLTSAEQEQIEKTLGKFRGLSLQQRAQCIRSFEQFANMTAAERQQFLKNAERWIMMTPNQRQAWRDLVEKVSITPTAPNLVSAPRPPPPSPQRSRSPALTTNGN